LSFVKGTFTVRLGWGSPGRPPKAGGRALPGASTAYSNGSFIDKFLAVLAPGRLPEPLQSRGWWRRFAVAPLLSSLAPVRDAEGGADGRVLAD